MGTRLRPTEQKVSVILEGPISWEILEEHEDKIGTMIVDKVRVMAASIFLEEEEE